MLIRHADPAADAAACAAIYAPAVADGVASLEERPPTADEMQRRMVAISVRYPWLEHGMQPLERIVIAPLQVVNQQQQWLGCLSE